MTHRFHLFFVIAFLLLISCEKKYYISQYKSVNTDKWKSTDTLDFIVDVEKDNMPLQFFLSVRHQKDYEFSNLWLKVYISGNESDTSFRYEIPLFKNDGKPYGKTSGSLCTQTVPLKSIFPVNKKGAYTFRVVQLMRKDPLDGISDIGILANLK